MDIPAHLQYSKDHEWVKVAGRQVTIGITDYAQDAMGDIVFVEFPEIGETISLGDALAVVESVKAASAVYSPVNGIVAQVNKQLLDAPETINSDPYGSWLVVIDITQPEEFADLLTAVDYHQLCEEA